MYSAQAMLVALHHQRMDRSVSTGKQGRVLSPADSIQSRPSGRKSKALHCRLHTQTRQCLSAFTDAKSNRNPNTRHREPFRYRDHVTDPSISAGSYCSTHATALHKERKKKPKWSTLPKRGTVREILWRAFGRGSISGAHTNTLHLAERRADSLPFRRSFSQ